MNMEMVQAQELLTKREVGRLLRKMGDRDSVALLDYLMRTMWDLGIPDFQNLEIGKFRKGKIWQ
jgi:hypothetical protein